MHAHGLKAVEKVGERFRIASSQTSLGSPSAVTRNSNKSIDGPRLCVTRVTRSRGAPPFLCLYHEYEPVELALYDSCCKGTGWQDA